MSDKDIIPVEQITNRIYFFRGQKVMLDRDLAALYGVTTKRLKEQVRRNISRFPEDFMFELSIDEEISLRSQIATLEGRGKHSKYLSFAFTKHGAIMAATVLNSQQAVDASIFVVRAFVKMREMLASSREFAEKLETLERRLDGHDEQIKIVFEAIRQLIAEDTTPKQKIGF